MKIRYRARLQGMRPAGRLSEHSRIYLLANLTCILTIVALAGPYVENRNEEIDSRSAVAASRIAEEVVRRVESGKVEPAGLSSGGAAGCAVAVDHAADFDLEARIIDMAAGEKVRLAVRVRWVSASGEKEMSILRVIDTPAGRAGRAASVAVAGPDPGRPDQPAGLASLGSE